MPALSNSRHERFAQELAKGKSATEALEAAGIPRRVCDRSIDGCYVYGLVDPRDDFLFYIGKGCKRRYAAHWRDMKRGRVDNVAKTLRLREIDEAGLRVEEIVLQDGLTDDAAYLVEQGMIRIVGFSNLTNVLRGVDTETSRALLQAKDMLRRIVPFETWKAKFRPDRVSESHYWFIIKNLREVVRGCERRLGLVPSPNF